MADTSIDVLIEGGKATAAPPLGPALGPLGVPIGQVVNDINTKTKDFKGMQVPVTVKVDNDTKEYTIKIGTPPASALIKQESNLKTASGTPGTDYIGNLRIEQIIKIAIMKEDDLSGKNLKNKVKEVVGTCTSMGVKINNDVPAKAIEKINAGVYDNEITNRKTKISEEERKRLEEEQKKLRKEREERFAKFESKAKEINDKMIVEGAEINDIRDVMMDAGIPEVIINKIAPLPSEEGA